MTTLTIAIFQQICKSLTNKGWFWNADPVLPESPALAEIYQAAHEERVTLQGTTAVAEIRTRIGTSTTHGYSNQDQLATLATHLQMLTAAGFHQVAVPWKYYGLAVFGGKVESLDSAIA